MRSLLFFIAVTLVGCVHTYESETPTHRSKMTESNWVFASDESFTLESKVPTEQEGAKAAQPRPTHLPSPCGLYCDELPWGVPPGTVTSLPR